MKIVAHPLLVAAALGLLGPAALTDDDEGEATERRDATPIAATPRAHAPDASEFARVEAEWHAAVIKLDDGLTPV